ncbi:hypothetical protein [Roseofilum casamattae]|uniref:DUF2281 domain-containing protein n=1 Tax=Roseofilum casamattae BLCC-M143 TaxID=3022442 RepID=A0ABT7BVI3_9CYAN|nr:hypothetical protein [Roseofilum casamattae]MDJ1183208.1 hypothetical protein [Roseofilum casamattae BLCC-M143]
MAITKEVLKQDIDRLTADQCQQVADFIALLKFRDTPNRVEGDRHIPLNPTLLAPLATEFAEEDRNLAETGMDEYVKILGREDE